MDHKKLRKPSEIRRDASGKFAKRETAAEILTCADSARVGDWTAAGNKLTQLENNLNALNEDSQGYGNQFYHSITVLEDDA